MSFGRGVTELRDFDELWQGGRSQSLCGSSSHLVSEATVHDVERLPLYRSALELHETTGIPYRSVGTIRT